MANIRQIITTGTSSGKGEAIKSGAGVLNQSITLLNQVENRLKTTESGLNVLVGVPGLIDDIFAELEILEDQISLTVSSAEVTRLTQTYDNQAVSQIAVEETVIDLAPGDILQIGNLNDIENPFTFEVSGSTVIAAGSTTIPIQPVDGTGTVTITAASGAPVVLDGLVLLTKIQLLKDEILLKANQTSVDAINGELLQLESEIQVLSDQIALVTQQGSAVELGVTAQAYSGTISSITLVDPIPIDLPLGSLLILDNPEKTEVYTTANYLASNNVTVIGISAEGGGAVTLPGTLASGSSVFLAGNLLLSKIQILADSITSTVRSFSQVNAVCRLTSQISAGSPITSISVTPLTTPLEVGDQLLIYNKDNLDTLLVTVSVAKETTSVNTTISINSVTPSAVIPVDSGVHVRESYAFSKIKQTKDSITTQVERFSLAGSLGVTASTYNENRSFITLSSGIPYDVKANDKFYIINKTTGVSIPITLSANVSAGATQLSIFTTFINAPSGSGVHVDTALLRSTLTQTASSITSTIESVSTAGAFSATTATYSGATTSIAVNAIPSALLAGQKIYIINRATGLTYPATLSANANTGATSISINSATIIATSGSGVHLDVSDYKTVITQTANGITQQASALYGTLFVGSLSAQYNPNNSTLSFGSGDSSTRITVPANSTLYVSAGTNKDQLFTVTTTSSSTPAGSTSLAINPQNITIPSGSNVYLSATQSSGQIKVLNDQVGLAVSRTTLRDFLNGSRLGRVVSSSTASVALDQILITVYKGDVLRFLPNPDFTQTEITHPPFDITIDSVSGTTINFTSNLAFNTTNMLVYLEIAGPTRVGSELNVYLNEITVDTTRIRSNNYVQNSAGWAINDNGTAEFNSIFARGTLQSTSYVAGSSGWRINAEGNAEFNNVFVRGSLTATATSGNNVRILEADGEVFIFAASTNSNSGGIHLLSNPSGGSASRFGLTLHENGLTTKQTTRKFTIFHNNDVSGTGGSLVMQYGTGSPSLKFWGVNDPNRSGRVTAGTFEAVGSSKFYGSFYKDNDKVVEFRVTDALNSSALRFTSNQNNFTSNTNVTTLAGHILVDINGGLYKIPFYTV
jgi:hypothetical protein